MEEQSKLLANLDTALGPGGAGHARPRIGLERDRASMIALQAKDNCTIKTASLRSLILQAETMKEDVREPLDREIHKHWLTCFDSNAYHWKRKRTFKNRHLSRLPSFQSYSSH